MTQYETIIKFLAAAVQKYISQESISFSQKELDNTSVPSIHSEDNKGVAQ